MCSKIGNSLKWSAAGEITSKLIAPVTNMILARILAPEDFGIIATINMIITFVDLFTDSGFAKYIIQCDFVNETQEKQSITIAFWTNLVLSIALWIMIAIFRFPIAHLVGNTGYEDVIIIASIQLIVTSFSSIQTAIYRRYFDYKTLFKARMLMSVIPLCVTLPLAILFKNYWALIIGNLLIHIVNAVFLTIHSSWKPTKYYSFTKLKEMLSFSIWSLAEAVAYWLTIWFDVFIIGSVFSAYFLGLYKNSLNTVNAIMALVKASIIPVLFSSLSRLKSDPNRFENVYFEFQFGASAVLIPMGVGIFVFREFTTSLLLGAKWAEASNIVGAWGLSSCIMATYINFNAEAYKAKGIPEVLFVYEILCLFIMVPCCYIANTFGFWSMIYTRAAVVLVQLILGLYFMKKYIGFSRKRLIMNTVPILICSIIMGGCGVLLKEMSPRIFWQICSIFLCVVIYFGILAVFFRKRIQKIIFTINYKG